ncbi:MAG: helix-turn-helix domain-containing protein [Agromyces sp.]
MAATAAALGLHRNTVSTRIQRAQELLGVDMTDPEARLALHLACRAVRESG